MKQFIFDLFNIIGGILLVLFGIYFSIKRHRKNSWYFFISAIVCFIIAIGISYFKNSESTTHETPRSKDSIAIKHDSSKQPQSVNIPKTNKSQIKSDSIQQLGAYLQMRAIVFVDYAKFDKLETNKIPKITWTMQNSGETGAHKVNMLYGLKIGTGIYKSDFNRIEKDTIPEYAIFPSHYTLPPQETYYNRALSAEELWLIQTGQKGLYFLGTVTYEDEFGKFRFTKFGFQYDTINGNAKIKYTDSN